MPRVDVIIPTYNRADLTARAVRSVQAQTFTEWRVILSDDASDAVTVAALRHLTADPRVVLVESEANTGPQAARQRGLERSDAEWVALLDSDDLWLPEKLERQVAAGDGFDAVLCWHQWMRGGQPDKPAKEFRGSGPLPPNLTTNMSTPLIRRTALDKVGGFLAPGMPSMRTAEGIEFYVRLAQHATYTVVPELLVECIAHAGPRSSGGHGTPDAAEDLAYTVDTYAEFLGQWPADYAVLLGRAGSRFLAVGERRRGLRYLRHAVRVAPEKRSVIRRFGPHAVKRMVR